MDSGSARKRQSLTLLAKVPASELRSIRVAVRRNNVTTPAPPGPLERSIDDPKAISELVHHKKDEIPPPKSLFDRDDILVNQEERYVLADANRLEPNNDNNSPNISHSVSKSPETNRNTRRRGRDRSRSVQSSRSIDHRKSSPKRDNYRRRSKTPPRGGEYKHSHRNRSASKDRVYSEKIRSPRRSRSLSKDRLRAASTSTRRSISPNKYRKDSNSRRYSRSPMKRSVSPVSKSSRYKDYRSRRSRSPASSKYLERRERSPDRNRRSRSPLRPDRGKHRSRSPVSTPDKYRRYSRSPGRYEGRKSRSPHPPIVTFSRLSRSDSRRSSRSPGYDRKYREYDRDSKRRRSRSPSHRSRSPHKEHKLDEQHGFYEGNFYPMDPSFRPMMPGGARFYPHQYLPRPLQGMPVMFPPQFPMPMMYPPVRQRFPIYNSRIRPKIPPQLGSVNETVSVTTDSSTVTTDTRSDTGEHLAIQEVSSEKLKTDENEKKRAEEKQ